MKKNIDDIIDRFKNGRFDVSKWFGDLETFFKVVERRGKIDEIEMDNRWQNDLLIYFSENNKDKFYDYCKTHLDDIEIENGKVYYVTDDVANLAKLFCIGKIHKYSKSDIQEILRGDYDPDWNNEESVDVYSEVIANLSYKNLKLLQERFVIELSGVEVSPETSLLESIASEQGHEEYVSIDSSNINEIFTDRKTVNYLLESELNDITTDLRRVYSYAAHSALSSDYYKEVWGKLLTSNYFKGKPEYITRPDINAKNKKIENVRWEIANFDEVITTILKEEGKFVESSILPYYQHFLNFLLETFNCLRLNFPDYPNVTPELINEFFVGYF